MRVTRSTMVRRGGPGSTVPPARPVPPGRLIPGRLVAPARLVLAAGALLAVGALLVAGCSSSGSKTVSTPAGAASGAGTAAATVAIRSTKVGAVLTDANGRTLYTYDKDTTGATTSACTGGCAAAWPPLTATGAPTAGAGVTGTLATISGGQVTWNGHPLYLWMGDKAPGDVTGDGINSFHAATAGGSSGGGTRAPTTMVPTSAARGGGYGY